MNESKIATSPESTTGDTTSRVGSSGAREFIRYFAASLVALCVDTGSLAFMTSILDVPYLVSGAVAFFLGLVVIYIFSIYWVFKRRDVHSKALEFGVFLVIGIVGFFINEGVLWLLTGYFGVFYLISKVASVFIVFTWNFFARKRFLFR